MSKYVYIPLHVLFVPIGSKFRQQKIVVMEMFTPLENALQKKKTYDSLALNKDN